MTEMDLLMLVWTLYFRTVLIMNFVVLNKNSSLVGFFNGRERKDRATVLLTKRADRGHQPTPGLRLLVTALPCCCEGGWCRSLGGSLVQWPHP